LIIADADSIIGRQISSSNLKPKNGYDYDIDSDVDVDDADIG